MLRASAPAPAPAPNLEDHHHTSSQLQLRQASLGIPLPVRRVPLQSLRILLFFPILLIDHLQPVFTLENLPLAQLIGLLQVEQDGPDALHISMLYKHSVQLLVDVVETLAEGLHSGVGLLFYCAVGSVFQQEGSEDEGGLLAVVLYMSFKVIVGFLDKASACKLLVLMPMIGYTRILIPLMPRASV